MTREPAWVADRLRLDEAGLTREQRVMVAEFASHHINNALSAIVGELSLRGQEVRWGRMEEALGRIRWALDAILRGPDSGVQGPGSPASGPEPGVPGPGSPGSGWGPRTQDPGLGTQEPGPGTAPRE